MITNPAIAHLIRDNQTHQLAGAIATGIAKGMCPLELSLANKVLEGLVDVEDAMAAANRPHILEEYLKTKGGGIAAQTTTGVAAAPVQAAPAAAQPQKSGFMSWGKK
jgi:Tfp pilus assembly ATPase PilU